MSVLQTIILAVLEGITEFLPVSSTGHLILASNLMRIPQTEFLKSFEIAIQLAAIIAVITLYKHRLTKNTLIWKNLLLSFIPTSIVGLLLYSTIKENFLENTFIVISALFIGGIVFILLELLLKNKAPKTTNLDNLSPRQAILIGALQSVSVIPGVSRAAATIFGSMIIGLDRKTAVEYSFLLAVPTMIAATGLDLLQSAPAFTQQNILTLAIGSVFSFISAYIVIQYFIRFIQNHTFVPFGIYRILLSLVFYFVFFAA